MTARPSCKDIVTGYLGRLDREFEVRTRNETCYIVTPFVRPDGEYVEVALDSQEGETPRLTDMGDTLGTLYVRGLALTPRLLEDVRKSAQRFGVVLRGGEILAPLEPGADAGGKLHSLIQAIISVNDLIQKRRPSDRIRFDDEVEAHILVAEVTYDVDFPVKGARLTHRVRFHVDHGRRLLLQPLSPTSESMAFAWAERWAFRFNDIRSYDKSWRCMAVLDDRGDRSRVWSARVLAPLMGSTLMWERKKELTELLQRPIAS